METNNTGAVVSPFARWMMPSIADTVFIFIFLMILSLGNPFLGDVDTDTAWHIRTGDYIVSRIEVPKTDIFSYRKYGETWIAHEWLADVILSLLHRFTGLNGVVGFSAFVIAFTIFLLFKMLETYRLNILVVTAVTVLAAVTSSIHWLARPHIFSMWLTLLWYFLLESHQRSPRIRHLFLFPLLMVFWVNLHGGYLVGFVLLGIYCIGNITSYLAAIARGLKPAKKLTGSTLLIALLSSVAALINPYGYRLLLFPFEILGSRVAMENIVEWHSPSFHQFGAYEFYLLLLIVTFLVSSKKTSVIELGVALFSIHVSLVGQRYIPIFAILMAPILAQRLDDLCRAALSRQSPLPVVRGLQMRITESISRVQFLNRNLSGHGYPIAVGLFMIFSLHNGGRAFGKTVFDYKFEGTRYPIRAVEFVRQNSLSGNMYNSYVFGGYLIYRFFPDPRYRVFVDGRGIVGGEDYFSEYLKVSQLTPEWQETLDKYKVNWIIEETNSPLTVFLSTYHEWKLVYSDNIASIFVKDTQENREVIEKYPGVKPAYGRDETGKI
jgi:hypothetical protein